MQIHLAQLYSLLTGPDISLQTWDRTRGQWVGVGDLQPSICAPAPQSQCSDQSAAHVALWLETIHIAFWVLNVKITHLQ